MTNARRRTHFDRMGDDSMTTTTEAPEVGNLYVELYYSAPHDIAPEYNGGRGRAVEMFRDHPNGVIAVVPNIESGEEALAAATALLDKAWVHFKLEGEPPSPWMVKVIDRRRMEEHYLDGLPHTGEQLTDDMIASSKEGKVSEDG